MINAFIRCAVSLALLAGIIVYFVLPVVQGMSLLGGALSPVHTIRGPNVPR
jgi:hypothetical protein